MTDNKNITKIYLIYSIVLDAEWNPWQTSEGIAFTSREEADKYIMRQVTPANYGIEEVNLYSHFDEDVL